jgi:hypothetical protein
METSCLITYECETRGCYAHSVDMGHFCPGVESRKAALQALCICDPTINAAPNQDCPLHGETEGRPLIHSIQAGTDN